MRVRLARNRFAIYVGIVVLAAACTFVPTPYSLILPGRAVDLGQVVSVGAGHEAQRNLFLTDVRFATRVTALELLSAFLPGVRVVRTTDVLPRGITAAEYEGVQREAMAESQSIAAFVAERAAGYHVPLPRRRVMIVYFAPQSQARTILHALDIVIEVNGHTVSSSRDFQMALRRVQPPAGVRVVVNRRGRRESFQVPTMAYRGRPAIGAYLTTIYERPRVPIAVQYHLPKVAGSSGGLMFALEIYRSLKGDKLNQASRVAGTGTIDYDGNVGPIEGASQKVAAAHEAGAQLFLVPRDNYAEIKDTRGLQIVPVSDFAQALHAVEASGVSPSGVQ